MSIVLGARSAAQNWQLLKKFAIATHSFEGEGEHEITLSVGDEIRIEEECPGWFKGTILASFYRSDATKTCGIFPAAFVKVGASIETLKMDREVILMESQEYLDRQDTMIGEFLETGDSENLIKVKEQLAKLLALRKKLVGKENEFWKKEMRQMLGTSIKIIERPKRGSRQLSMNPIILREIGSAVEKNVFSSSSSSIPFSSRIDRASATNLAPVNQNATQETSPNLPKKIFNIGVPKGRTNTAAPPPNSSENPNIAKENQPEASKNGLTEKENSLNPEETTNPVVQLRKQTRAAELKSRTSSESIISLYRSQTEQRNRLVHSMSGSSKLGHSPSFSKSPPTSPGTPNSAKRRPTHASPLSAHKTTSSERIMAGPPSPSQSSMNLTKGMNLRGSNDISPSSVKIKETKFYHLMIDIKAFMCSTGEPSEISCSIFRGDTKKFVTEDYVIKMTANGMPEDPSKIGNARAIFKDISESELNPTSELYLVVKITRVGKLASSTAPMASSSKSSKAKSENEFRRPFGGAVQLLQFSELIGNSLEGSGNNSESEDEGNSGSLLANQVTEVSHTLPIFTCEMENDMYNLHEAIIKKHGIVSLPLAKGIVLGFKLYTGQYEEVYQSNADKWNDVPSVSRLFFPDSGITAARNDFYLTLESAKFPKSDNIQVNVVMRGDDGEVIPNSISSGVGQGAKKEHQSLVLVKEASPIWRDTINIQIPYPKFLTSHAYFTLKSVHESSSKEKELCFGYLPLATAKGCAIEDGEHSISFFTIPKDEKFVTISEGGMSLVNYSIYKEEAFKQSKALRKDETMKIRTLLTSTQLTNNNSMFQLLKWKEQSPDTLPDILNMFTYIPTPEVLKFFRESFNALFEVMETNNEQLQALVYNALVFMVGLFVDDKTVSVSGAQLKPVLDKYLDEQFNGATAHMPILQYIKEALGRNVASKINPTLKSLEYLMRFAIKSRIRQKNSKDSEEADVAFKKELGDVFDLINKLMEKTDATFRGAQTYVLKNFGQLGTEIGKIFTGTEYAMIIKAFLESIQYDASLKLLNSEKLAFIRRIIKNSHLVNEDSQVILYLSAIKAINPHLKSTIDEEKLESITIINDILQKVETVFKVGDRAPEVMDELSKLIPSIMKHIISLKEGPSRMDAITCLLVTFSKMKPREFETMLSTDPNSIGIVLRILKIFHSLIILPPYPDTWITLILFQYTAIATTTTQLFELITQAELHKKKNPDSTPNEGEKPFEMKASFDLFKSTDLLKISGEIPRSGSGNASILASPNAIDRKETAPGNQSSDIYRHFFKLSTLFLQSKVLAELANSAVDSSAKVNALNKGFLQLIESVWSTLEKATKVEFIHTIMPILLDFLIIPSEEFRKVASNLYFDAMEAEYDYSEEKSGTGNLTLLDARSFDCMRKISEDDSKEFTEEWVDDFINSIRAKTNELPEEQSQKKTRFLKLIQDTKEFTGLLHELRTLPTTSAYQEDRTAANLKLVDYLRITNRPEGYVTFLMNLAENQEKAKNYTEAGETLLLIASLYNWSEEKVPSIAGSKMFIEETEALRKEKLYTRAVEAFTNGKLWEKSIALLKEMALYFEFKTYDYHKLTAMLDLQSGLFKQILKEHRFFNEYFIVGFYGKGFDKNLRGKVFIYRGLEAERREDFVERIKELFPDAEVLSYSHDPPPELTDSEGKHLQITPVKPSSTEELEGKPSKIPADMPSNLQRYYKSNEVNTFLFSKPFRKTKTKSDNEFKDLWLRNTFYITQDKFPAIQRRSPVVKRVEVEVSPIETAVKAMKEKNLELKDQLLKNDNAQNHPSALQDFVMVFKGVIDAAVNGGTDRYKDAFFTDSYLKENEQDLPLINSLKEELDYQFDFLDKGMELMKRKVVKGSDMSNLLTILEEQLATMTQKTSRSSSSASSLNESLGVGLSL